MSCYLTIAILSVLLLVAFFYTWLKFIPILFFSFIKKASRQDYNSFKFIGVPTSETKGKMPNPEVAYLSGFFRFSGKEIILSGKPPLGTWTSIAFYDDKLHHFKTVDYFSGGDNISLKLLGPHNTDLRDKHPEKIPLSGSRGLILIRFFTNREPDIIKAIREVSDSFRLIET